MKKKILIADCDPVSLSYYERVFMNHHLFTTTDGKDALEMFFEHQPDFVIINSHLNNIDGFKVVEEIRALNEIVKIFMIAAYHDDRKRALNVGCDDFHTKPISLSDLQKIIE
ncbi:MAG: response regulator [Candidatus Falkowbacteria bacterium]